MSFHMVDGDQRFPECPSSRFRCGDTDQQRAHEPRPLRHGDGIDILPVQMRFFEGFDGDRKHILDMVAGRDLRHDTAEFLMDRHLGGDHIG